MMYGMFELYASSVVTFSEQQNSGCVDEACLAFGLMAVTDEPLG
jgi:hypothetical protein